MLRRSYYLILGVSRAESATGIRRAFTELVRRYHPDRVGPRCLSYFQQIVEAYRVLSDPRRRSDYDQRLPHDWFEAVRRDDEYFVAEFPLSLRVEMNRPLFEAALTRVAITLADAGAPPVERCEGLDVQVILSAEQAAKGGMGAIAVPSCAPCPRCGGAGREGLFPCTACDGEGLVEEEETVRLKIPPMVADGALLEIPLRGLGVHNFYLRAHIRVAP